MKRSISLIITFIVLFGSAFGSSGVTSGGGSTNPQGSVKPKPARRVRRNPHCPREWTAYPPLTERDCFGCPVAVEVAISENGNVISARAISGDLLLRQASVFAAKQEKFPPKVISGQPVKYTEKVSYKLVRQ